MNVQANGMDQSSVSVVFVGYDSSRPALSERREVQICRCNSGRHYALGRHERGIIRRQYPHKSVQFLTGCHTYVWSQLFSRIFRRRERISCLALLGK